MILVACSTPKQTNKETNKLNLTDLDLKYCLGVSRWRRRKRKAKGRGKWKGKWKGNRERRLNQRVMVGVMKRGGEFPMFQCSHG